MLRQGQIWDWNKYFTPYSDFSRSWISIPPSQPKFYRVPKMPSFTFHRQKNHSSGKNQASPFSRLKLTSLYHQLSAGVKKKHPTSLDWWRPPFMSLPGSFDLSIDLHRAQLKKALMTFHLIYYSFWASLFKDLQDTLFHLSPEWKQAFRSNWFAFSLPTTVPEIPADRTLLNLTPCHSSQISKYEILLCRAMKSWDTVVLSS